MTDMVEKVAQELAGYIQAELWKDLPEHRKAVTPRAEYGKECFRELARAAIRALMEPTPRMISAGIACEPETAPLGELWQAMLKAALDEPEQDPEPEPSWSRLMDAGRDGREQ